MILISQADGILIYKKGKGKRKVAKTIREKTLQAYGVKVKVIWNRITDEKIIVISEGVKIIKQKSRGVK